MDLRTQKYVLQAIIAILAVIPICTGLMGVIRGISIVPGVVPENISLDSHFRYLSGLLLGIGFSYWKCIPHIEKQGKWILFLSVIVIIGGLARAISYLMMGAPPTTMLGGMVMELILVPLLCLWQFYIARRWREKNDAP